MYESNTMSQTQQKSGLAQFKGLIIGALAIIAIVVLGFNLFGYNNSGERVVKISITGKESVIFEAGPYFDGFARTFTYPDQISLVMDDESQFKPKITFNGGGVGYVLGVVKFSLPKDEKSMLSIHHDYRSAEGLIHTGLSKFTIECLNTSSQLMTPEMHYMGGKSTMSQYFQDQLDNGVYILLTKEKSVMDSTTKESQKEYFIEISKDKTGTTTRKRSALNTYNITIGDAIISDVDYDSLIDNRIKKLMETATKTAVSKSNTINAQQEALTAEAQGKKKLVEIEYIEKQTQTTRVIQAQTELEVAKQNMARQTVLANSAEQEARKIKILADADAYARQKAIAADNAINKKIDALITINTVWASAFKEYGGNIVPLYQAGSLGNGGASNGMQQFMEMQNMKAMRDLGVNLNLK